MSPDNSTSEPDVLAAIESAVGENKLAASSLENLRRWLEEPHYASYRPAITEMVENRQWERLDLLFFEVIPFGTGGRRGMMADFGSATINVRTIAESAQGLAAYLQSVRGDAGGTAVVARDTRNRSEEFAQLTATTLAANGLHVSYFADPRSTPELSFAVRHLGCDVGVMITASHNPPGDNGFKAYWSSGGQVLPPHDAGIIEQVYAAGEIPTMDFEEACQVGRISVIDPDLDESYLNAVQTVQLSEARDVSLLFTPLHGVGETNVFETLRRAGFSGAQIFEPQRRQDGDFPHVPDRYPNPERPQVFELAIAEAAAVGADLVLASDPDADRLGVAVADRSGEFHVLSGNQVAALILDHVLAKRSEAGRLTEQDYAVTTMVTTPLFGAIARARHVRCLDELLVGFKYIGQTMDREGPDGFLFGAEESLGYLAGSYARDKDAAIGALYIAELAAELRGEGRTLLDRLDELYERHGYYLENQRSEVCPGASGKEQIGRIMAALRSAPPERLGDVVIAEIRDYQMGEVRSLPGNRHLAEIREPCGNLLFLDSAAGPFRCSIAVRPSGTEPKIKFYGFASMTVEPGQLAAAKQLTADRLQGVQEALSQWAQTMKNEKC